jgi:hypothetical protein
MSPARCQLAAALAAAEVRLALLGRRGGRIALVTEADAAALQIVWRHLDNHPIADAGTNPEFAHFPGGIGQYFVFVVEFHPEVSIRQNFRHGAVEFQQFFLRHSVFSINAIPGKVGTGFPSGIATTKTSMRRAAARVRARPRLLLHECNSSNAVWLRLVTIGMTRRPGGLPRHRMGFARPAAIVAGPVVGRSAAIGTAIAVFAALGAAIAVFAVFGVAIAGGCRAGG